jgi:peptidoglycan/xylan/chitin deacetylase (PgdA/CDA1 family)
VAWLVVGLAFGGGVLAASSLLVQPAWLPGVLARVYPDILWRVETARPRVALTFDDGPALDHTPIVLRTLARHGAHATFFMVGDRATAAPELLKAVREAGHEIGNHYYTIRSTLRASDQEFEANLVRTESILSLTSSPKLYRPPGGLIRSSQLAIVRKHGYRCVMGSAYPFDPSHPSPAYIRWLVTKNLTPGAIVILHDGIADPSRMLAVLDDILRAGEEKGLEFVTVGELLEES